MRIMLVIHSLRKGGAERVLLELALGFKDLGHTVLIISWIDINEYQEPRYNQLQKDYLISNNQYRWINSIPRSRKILKRKISNFAPDIIQVHSPNIAFLLPLVNINKARYFHVLHGYGIISDVTNIKQRVYSWFFKAALVILNARIIVVSPSMSVVASRYFKRLNFSIDIISNGVAIQSNRKFKSGKFLQSHDHIVISMLGTLCDNKGQHLGIQSFKELLKVFPMAIMKIAGDGPNHEYLKKLIRLYGLESNIFLENRVDDISDFFSKSSLLWQLSFTEAAPMSVLEAMSYGVPVVGFNVRGIQDVIVNEYTGILVEYGDLIGVTRKSIEILNNQELYIKISRSAQLSVFENFSLDTMVKSHLALFTNSLSN
jgi:glycosyltransferase involved in cell wall biosynthesis